MHTITISHTGDIGQRLDRFIKKYLPNVALGALYKMLRTGKIKVNRKKKDQTYKIELGDEITFWLSDEEISRLVNRDSGIETRESRLVNQESFLPTHSRISVLYEDEYLMVVNKPSGLSVHAGDHKTKESNLIDQVQDALAGRYDSLTFRPSLVHRIDRDTSGCVIIAKEKSSLEKLLYDLQHHKIEKVYHAIVVGVPPKKEDTIRAKILRIANARDEAKVQINEGGQTAITHYKAIDALSKWDQKTQISLNQSREGNPHLPTHQPLFSLLECRIETGRTHQIRVHMAHIGCPILGDKAYGNKSINSYVRRHIGIERQMLHARRLSFIHPKTGKTLIVDAPYPPDFQKFLDENA